MEAIRPCNVWLIDQSSFDRFTFTGGKVIYIAEDVEFMYKTHPAITTASILLPPVNAIQAELDDEYDLASQIYCEYLQTQEVGVFLNIIALAALQNVPIGIMFGKDEMNQRFPQVFINFMYDEFGLVIGVENRLSPYMLINSMPHTLMRLYLSNMINLEYFMVNHPPIPISPLAIPKLVAELNPPISSVNMADYAEYFNNYIRNIINGGGKFLIDPLVGDRR